MQKLIGSSFVKNIVSQYKRKILITLLAKNKEKTLTSYWKSVWVGGEEGELVGLQREEGGGCPLYDRCLVKTTLNVWQILKNGINVLYV